LAQVFQFNTPPRRPRSWLTADRLAGLALAAGTAAAWFLAHVPAVGGLAMLLGLCAAFAIYAGLYDRAR
jgi:hypothetical protein